MTAQTDTRALPRWCELFDVVAVACAAAAFALLIAGPYRDVWFGITVSLKWEHAIFAALAAAAIRHAAVSSPSVASSVRSWWRRAAERTAFADAIAAFWLTRPAVLLAGFLAVVTIGVIPRSAEVMGARDPLATFPARFDSGWYAGIAAEGYEWQHRFDRQQNLVFFPAYPLLMRAGGAATGVFDPGVPPERRILRLIWIGLAISLAAFFWALWYFSRLAHEILEIRRASLAVILLAAYPFALFYSAAYTESLYLLAALGAWYHFRHREWATAALWGLLAGLTRPNGFLLAVPLGLFALGVADARADESRAVERPAPLPALAVAVMPVAGMLLFTAYVYHLTGVWFAWSRVQAAWGRVFGAAVPGAFETAWNTGGGLLSWAAAHPYSAMNALGLLFALSLIWPVWRRLGTAWAIFVAANVLLPLVAGGLLSMGRLTSTLFPIFLAFSARLSPRAAIGCAAAFGVLQGLAAALFFTWREMF
jgi:hypothetical protein